MGAIFIMKPRDLKRNLALDSLAKEAGVASSLVVWSPRTKSEKCFVRGSLPDPECTPGAVFATTSLEDLCSQGYTKTVRNVPEKLKRKVYEEYGFSYPQPFGTYEADHFIPLELGGSNDIANLFPEAAMPAPGFREKDIVEHYLHQEVCLRHIDLSEAQVLIDLDWVKVYEIIDPDTKAALERKYKSWTTTQSASKN